MPRRRVWDLKSMSDDELRALIHHCNGMEQRLTGGHSKARRTWTKLRARASSELERRHTG